MERAISPSPTPTPGSSLDAGTPTTASANPQRSLVADRRTSYRLFPIVDQTPPASPVLLQRATLSKAAGNHRRRSSSLDHHRRASKASSAASGHAALSTSALRLREGDSNAGFRKGSLPDIRPLRAVNELNGGHVSAQLQTLPPRPHTAMARAQEGSIDACSNGVAGDSPPSGDGHGRAAAQVRDGEVAAYGRGFANNSLSTPAVAGQSRRVRSRPNLRINVAADHGGDERPPPPPPKSPRHARGCSDESHPQANHGRRHGKGSAHVRDDSDPPSSPSVAQQQSLVSLSPSLKVREFTVSPVARGRAVRKEISPKMHELLPGDFLEKPLPSFGPTLQQPSIKSSGTSARPSTSDGSTDTSNAGRGASIPPPQRQPPPRPVETRPSDQPSSSRWSRMIKPNSRNRSIESHDVGPTSPEVRPLASHPVKADWHDLPTFATRPAPAQRTITPEPQSSHDGNAFQYRGHHTLGSRSKSSNNLRDASTDYMPPESLSKASLALAAARANVAALRNPNVSVGSPGSERRSRSSGSDIGSLNRHPSDGLPRRPASPWILSNPVETLKDLNEQVEALHSKYAALKTERQKISSSITNRLKEPNFGPESADSILDEQLSLAAVSSSMDICFAKLKSLDCRKEDAIAALIAKTTHAQKSPTDNISTMIASMALTRKASFAHSIDSGSRFAPTGRSTPDLGDASSMNRSTQPSARAFSYGSEPESLDYRLSSLSRKQSNGGDSILYDGVERQTPATIPEDMESPRSHRVSTIHDTGSVLDQRTSDVSALSPVLESHPRRSLSETSLEAIHHGQEVELAGRYPNNSAANESEPSPPSERSMSPEDLLDERPKKIRVNGSKAAKILGLLGKSSDGKDSPLIRLPGDEEKAPVRVTEVEVELHPTYRLESVDDTNNSLLSVRTKDTDGSLLTTDTQASSEPSNLDDQLKSFPTPNPNTLSTHSHSSDNTDSRRDTGGSFLTNGSSAESSCEPDEPEPPAPVVRSGRGQDAAKSKNEMRKRDPSAHTIQVFLEDDELLKYYNRMRR